MTAQATGDAPATTFAELFDAIAANIERVIQGKPDVVELALICLLAEGHLLIEDVPGVGKTSLAKALAALDRLHVEAGAVHPRPAALRRRRRHRVEPGHRQLRVPARAGVRQHRPRRRDQPGLAEDAVRRSSRPWRSARSRSTAPPTRSSRRSW